MTPADAQTPLEPSFVSATDLAAQICRREISPVEVIDGLIARIEAHNARTGAYVCVLAESARLAAQAAERAVVRGPVGDLGPLHGVPVAIKDLGHFKAGVGNTFGSRPFADFRRDEHLRPHPTP